MWNNVVALGDYYLCNVTGLPDIAGVPMSTLANISGFVTRQFVQINKINKISVYIQPYVTQIMQLAFLLFIAIFSCTQAYIFSWGNAATGATGAIGSGCPPSFADVISTGDFDSLTDCDEKQLRDMYTRADCCISFVAECNYVERAWWGKTNVLRHSPLCSYMLRSPEHAKREHRRRFIKRIKNRFATNLIMLK